MHTVVTAAAPLLAAMWRRRWGWGTRDCVLLTGAVRAVGLCRFMRGEDQGGVCGYVQRAGKLDVITLRYPRCPEPRAQAVASPNEGLPSLFSRSSRRHPLRLDGGYPEDEILHLRSPRIRHARRLQAPEDSARERAGRGRGEFSERPKGSREEWVEPSLPLVLCAHALARESEHLRVAPEPAS